ncbi:MAG: hypothetical protein GY830_08115, partial [Bacteroidetes bacterium]|nr:hypothetical protein [Bacteroidota bacterium]
KLFVKCGSTVIKGLDYVMKNPKATVKEVNEFLKSSKEIVQALGGADTIKLAQEMINVSSEQTVKAIGDEIKNYPKNFIEEFENADYKRRLEMGGEVFVNALIATEAIKNIANTGIKSVKNCNIENVSKKAGIASNNGVANIGTKLEYVFGKATGSVHNIERSTGMLRQLESVGIFDNTAGRSLLENHIKSVFSGTKGIIQSNGRYLRESLLMGTNGGLKVESIWEGNKLITIKLFGGK